MPYPFPYAMPDEPIYAPPPAYGGEIGRVKIQVSNAHNTHCHMATLY